MRTYKTLIQDAWTSSSGIFQWVSSRVTTVAINGFNTGVNRVTRSHRSEEHSLLSYCLKEIKCHLRNLVFLIHYITLLFRDSRPIHLHSKSITRYSWSYAHEKLSQSRGHYRNQSIFQTLRNSVPDNLYVEDNKKLILFKDCNSFGRSD